MASYTVRVGGTGDKAASIDGDPDIVAECMSPATAAGETYLPGDVILFADTGGDYRLIWYSPSAGDAGDQVYQRAYPGHTPIFNGSNLTTGWTNYSGDVWQKTGVTSEPSMIFLDDTTRGTKQADIGSLAAEGDWVWASNVAYLYTTNASGPDSEWTTVELADRRYCVHTNSKSYNTFDGITMKHSDWLSAYVVGSDFTTFVNCTAQYSMVGFKVVSESSDTLFDSCTTEYHSGDGFAVSGGYSEDDLSNKVWRLTITGCVSRENMYILGVNTGSGTGIKAFGLKDSLITKSTWNDNDQGGIRLDGGTVPAYWGCENNVISENLLYENGGVGGIDGDPSQVDQIMLEFSDYNDCKFNWVYDCVDGGYNIGVSRSSNCNIFGNVTWGASGTSVGSIRTYFSASKVGQPNYFVGNIIDESYFGFSINGDGYDVLRNNIVTRSTTGADLRFASEALAALCDSDYNCFAGGGSGAVTVVGAIPRHKTLAQWQAYSGQDTHSIDDDPLFTDPDNRDYTLQSGSPCINIADNTLGSPFHEGIVSGVAPDTLVIGDRGDY